MLESMLRFQRVNIKTLSKMAKRGKLYRLVESANAKNGGVSDKPALWWSALLGVPFSTSAIECSRGLRDYEWGPAKISYFSSAA